MKKPALIPPRNVKPCDHPNELFAFVDVLARRAAREYAERARQTEKK